MDLNLFRQIITVAGLVCFVLIALWAYSRSSKSEFDAAAMQPIDDDDLPRSSR